MPSHAARLLAAPDLATLLDVIRSLPEDEDHATEHAMTELPTYGGQEPRDTSGVWSWDEKSLLVGRGDGDMTIVSRTDRDGWPDWLRHSLAPRVSLDNGNRYYTAVEVDAGEIPPEMLERLWDALVQTMEDEARELAHAELVPCDNATFLARYLELADDDLVIG